MQFTARIYNTIVKDEEIIYKSSTEERLADEIEYYKSLPPSIRKKWFLPRLDLTHQNILALDYFPGSDLGAFMIPGDKQKTEEDFWYTISDRIKGALKRFHEHKLSNLKEEVFVPFSREMYINKTEREFLKFAESPEADIRNLCRIRELVINGKRCLGFPILWEELRDHIEREYLIYTPVLIHGDMCFANILYYGGEIKFVDPRGSFGCKGIYGDVYYDLAKLSHSYNGGYEYLIRDQFTLSSTEGQIMVDLHGYNDIPKKVFEKTLMSKYNMTKVKTLEGLIYIGMCTRHYEDPIRQIAMYLTGVRILNEVMEG